jgi:transcriptional regulator with XRE-family HTH domain
MLHKRIREILEASPHLTQKGLAEFMGLDPAAVNRLLHGRRNIMAQEIPLIEQYLGQKIRLDNDDYPQPAAARASGVSDVAAARLSPAPDLRAFDTIPVLGRDMNHTAPLDWTQRHPRQAGLPGAFAFFVDNDDMAPRYERGNTAYIHPRRPAVVGQDVLFVFHSGDVFLARLDGENREEFILRRFAQPMKATVRKTAVKQLFPVVGVGF